MSSILIVIYNRYVKSIIKYQKANFFGFLGFLGSTTLVQFGMESVIWFTFAKCSIWLYLSPSKNDKQWKFCSRGFVDQYCFVASGLKIAIKYYSGIQK